MTQRLIICLLDFSCPSLCVLRTIRRTRLFHCDRRRMIEWPQIEQEAECNQVGADTDVYFDKVEAWG